MSIVKDSDPLATCYNVRPDEVARFGNKWCGPKVGQRWPNMESTLVARYQAQEDGQPVEIYVSATPARFYEIRVLALRDKPAFTLGTGSSSGSHELAHEIAEAISTGMLGLNS